MTADHSPAAPQEGTTPPDASTFTTASTGPAITINASANPRVCGKCGGAFTLERPEIIVGDEASGYWKPRFSAHSECIDYAGNGGVSSSGTTTDEISERAKAVIEEAERHEATATAFRESVHDMHPFGPGPESRGEYRMAAWHDERAALLRSAASALASSLTSSQTDSSLRAAESHYGSDDEALQQWALWADRNGNVAAKALFERLRVRLCASFPTVTPPQTPTALIGENELEMIARRAQHEIDVGVSLVDIGASRTILKLAHVIREIIDVRRAARWSV